MAYKIKMKIKEDKYSDYEDEMFLTGGKKFAKFNDAINKKNKLQKMTSSIKYKVVKE
jgi:hypothetical protein